MAEVLTDLVLVVAAASNGLLAGVFFVFACAICPGLRTVDDRGYVTTFRAINTSILNPVFLLVFAAAPLTAIGTAALRPGTDRGAAWPWLIAAGCSVMTFVITAAGNVPLNNSLANAGLDTDAQYRQARQRFEKRWNRWNLLRSGTSTAASVLLAVAAAG